MNNISFFLIALVLTGSLVLYTGYNSYHYEDWTHVVKKAQPKWYPGIDQHTAKEIIRLEAESLAAEKKMEQWDKAMHEMLEKTEKVKRKETRNTLSDYRISPMKRKNYRKSILIVDVLISQRMITPELDSSKV